MTATSVVYAKGERLKHGRMRSGLITLIHKSRRHGSSVTNVPTSKATQGCLLPQLVNTGPQKILLVSVYVPPICTEDAADEVRAERGPVHTTRGVVLEELSRVLTEHRGVH